VGCLQVRVGHVSRSANRLDDLLLFGVALDPHTYAASVCAHTSPRIQEAGPAWSMR
jgi:hypothetical protein